MKFPLPENLNQFSICYGECNRQNWSQLPDTFVLGEADTWKVLSHTNKLTVWVYCHGDTSSVVSPPGHS